MGRYDKGVEWFTVCSLEMNVFFPQDEVKCRWCPFMMHQDSVDRDRCTLTNETLYSREIIGLKCPLVILNEVKTEDMK